MNAPLQRTPAESAYLDAFADLPPDSLGKLRKAAFERFASAGLPHRRLEDWKWTDLRRMLDGAYPPRAGSSATAREVETLIARSPLSDLARARLVFVDGKFDQARSTLPASGDVEVVTLGAGDAPEWLEFSPAETDQVDALNIAYLSDGAGIRFKKAANADAPIELLFVNTANVQATCTTRNVIHLAEGASATILECHVGGPGNYVANSVADVRLAANARLDRVKIVEEGANGIHLSNLIASIGENANLRDFTLSSGGRAARNQGFITFQGEHANASVSGAYMLNNTQHVDTRLVVDHAVPNCTSRELFKCVMDDEARGIFQGKVVVRQDAQKTDGKQSSHALLLSETAEFDAKPELEIYADDVVCGHGATSGELDEDMLFYLRARGIPEARAKSLLISAFVGEAFDEVALEPVRDVLHGLAESWLEGRAEG